MGGKEMKVPPQPSEALLSLKAFSTPLDSLQRQSACYRATMSLH
jgi:hypothetical protein